MAEKGATKNSKIRHGFETLLLVVFFLYVVVQALFNENEDLVIIPNAVMLLFFVLSVMHLFMGAKFEFGPHIIFTGLFLVICVLSSIWAIRPDMSSVQCSTLFKLWLMLIFVFNVLYQTKKLDLFPIALLVSSLVMCVYLLLVYGPSEYITMLSEGDRLGGEVANENSIGLMASNACLICFYYGMLLNKRRFYLLLPLPLLTVAASGSRKALVMVIFSFIMMYLLKPREKGDKRAFIRGILGAIIAVSVFFLVLQLPMFDLVKERMESFFNIFGDSSQVDNSTMLRLKMIEAGWEVFLQNPFTGVGIGNSYFFVFEYTGQYYYTHNNYIELLSSVGLFGTLFYYASYIYLLVKLLKRVKKREPLVLLSLCMIVMTLVEDFALVSYYSKSTFLELAFYFLVVRALYANDAEAERAAYDAEHPLVSPFIKRSEATFAAPVPIKSQLKNLGGFDPEALFGNAPFFINEALSPDDSSGPRLEFEPPQMSVEMINALVNEFVPPENADGERPAPEDTAPDGSAEEEGKDLDGK